MAQPGMPMGAGQFRPEVPRMLQPMQNVGTMPIPGFQHQFGRQLPAAMTGISGGIAGISGGIAGLTGGIAGMSAISGLGGGQGIQAGVRYMPFIVPLDQLGSTQLPAGTVAVGQLPADAGGGQMAIQQYLAQQQLLMQRGQGGQDSNAMLTNMPGGQGLNSSSTNMQGNRGQVQWGAAQVEQTGRRPTRGRSPMGRTRPSANNSAPERDWESLRQPRNLQETQTARNTAPVVEASKASGASGKPLMNERDSRASLAGSSGKVPWRPAVPMADRPLVSVDDRPRSPQRRLSVERRSSTERRLSAERRRSVERRHSAGPEHRVGRSKSVGRTGVAVRTANYTWGSQPSEQWMQSLFTNENAQAWFIADPNTLAYAIQQLSQVGPDTLMALDLQGMHLHTAAGRLCLIQISLRPRLVGLVNPFVQCFLIDVIQLGDSIRALAPIFVNETVSKLVHDAQTAATVLAHQFGMEIKGVIDAMWAYGTLNGKFMANSVELMEWCGLAAPSMKVDALKMDQNPEGWAQRPMTKAVMSYSVQSACMLLSTWPVLQSRLIAALGPAASRMTGVASAQRVSIGAAAGWACRQAGLWTEEYKAPAARGCDEDAQLDNWLAARFGAKATNRAPSAARRAHSQETKLPPAAVRETDSPRTASWRAAVAQVEISHRIHQRPQSADPGGRNRSESPTLDNWLARRQQASSGALVEQKSRRASSVPVSKVTRTDGLVCVGNEDLHPQFDVEKIRQNFQRGIFATPEDRRAWAEILEEEQANAEEGRRAEEDLFQELHEEEKRRLAQVELSTKSSR